MEALRQSPRGRYRLLEQLGEGSLGIVYRARDTRTGLEVAVKTLRGASAFKDGDVDRVRRLFSNEASVGAIAPHPGIARIYDLIEEPVRGELYLVMEFVPGVSLAKILSRPDPLPLDFVASVVCRVAEALDHVHAHGIIHRDIKPANIMIGPGSDIKVTDFGISELRSGDLGEEMRRAGSPNYMAPERVLGTGDDHRADIWALGVILYEMATRRLPFHGESVGELIQNVALVEPPKLDSCSSFSMPGLQAILDRALAKEPGERYQRAGELAEALQAVQASQLSLSATLPAEAIPELQRPPVVEADTVASEPTVLPPSTVSEGPWAGISQPEEADAEPVVATVAAEAAAEESAPPPERSAVLVWLEEKRVLLLGLVGLVLLVIAVILGEMGRPAPPDEALGASPSQSQRLEYIALLEEARSLIERGENQAAAELFARAEVLSPNARRIRALREEARRQAEMELAVELDYELAAWIGMAEADLAEDSWTDAAAAAERALELRSDDPRALAVAAAVDAARQAAERRARTVRAQEEEEPPPVPEPPPAAPEPIRIVQPIQPPVSVPVPTFADLKVDFYSDTPRGVITVYRGDSQILRRAFRFVEKKGFMRSRGVSGGFDEQIRVSAGPSEFRVYLSLPGRETEVRRISGILPAGTIRALKLRVDADGEMSVGLH